MDILSSLTAIIMCDLVNPTRYLWSNIQKTIGDYNQTTVTNENDLSCEESFIRPDYPTREGSGISLDTHYSFWTKHEIESFLGGGTFGKVYSVRNKSSKQVTVFKWMDNENVTPKDINREINILKNVPDHIDFLPKFLAAGIYEHKGIKHYGIEMERIVGSDLDKFMRINFHFMNYKYDLVMQMINIVHYLHAKLGIVHRDLKVQNFMYNVMEHKLTLIDFGMAECYDENHPYYEEKFTTGNKMKIGTALYLSPEMLNKTTVVTPKDFPSIDIWALGITFYFLYYGIEPFGQKDNCSLDELTEEVETYCTNPASLNLSNITHDKVLTLVKNCLKPNPAERWTINQMMDCVYEY